MRATTLILILGFVTGNRARFDIVSFKTPKQRIKVGQHRPELHCQLQLGLLQVHLALGQVVRVEVQL